MNYIRGIVNGPKSPTTEPRCHSDQVDPLVINCDVFNTIIVIKIE